MTKRRILAVFIAFLIVFFAFSLVLAQENTSGNTQLDTELEGVNITEPTEAPSNLGLWWREIKERVSLTFTFNPVRKAEKMLQFAEERMKIAQVIVEESDDSKIEDKAERMIERAGELMEKINENKDRWMENQNERVERLIRNVASHQLRKQDDLDEIEEDLAEDQVINIQGLRGNAIAGSQRLINAIENESVSEEIRDHLLEVKERIEEHAQQVNIYQEQRREIIEMEQIEDNDDSEALYELNHRWLENIQERVRERRESRVNFEQNICPQYSPPAPGWCDGGEVTPGIIDEDGCQGPPRCILPTI